MHQPDVAVVDIRMPPTHTDEGLRRGEVDPRPVAVRRRARPLAVRRAGLRDRAAAGLGRGRRLPAQGPRRGRRRVRRRRAPRRPRAARRSTRRSSRSSSAAAAATTRWRSSRRASGRCWG